MLALDALLNRSSAVTLTEPGPTPEQLDIILRAGQAAPDHGRLQPWRFVILEGKARELLADSFAAQRIAKDPGTDPDTLAKERTKAYRAPTIIAVAAVPAGGKIPEIEQFAAVAAATQNMFLAAFAQGLGAMWKTGGPAYDSTVKARLSLAEKDHIVAFLYLGTDSGLRPAAPKRSKDVVSRLPG
jgi:nitroreductase